MKYWLCFALIGICLDGTAGDKFSLRSPRALRAEDYRPRRVYVSNDLSREFLDVDAAHAGIAFRDGDEIIPFTGKGVCVAMIDGGIDPRHPAFADRTDPARSRVALYVVTNSAEENESGGLSYEVWRPAEGEPVPDECVDVMCNGHGTHTSGTAAGAPAGNSYYGVAPDATLIMVSMGDLLYDDEVMAGIGASFDYAGHLDMPCVASLSLGTVVGPHSGHGLLENVLGEKMADSGQMICFAAGNDGAKECHLERDFASDPAPLATALAIRSGRDFTSRESYTHIYGTSADWGFAVTVIATADGVSREILRSRLIRYEDLTEETDLCEVCPEIREYFGEGCRIMASRLPDSYGRPGIELAGETPRLFAGTPYTIGVVVESDEDNVAELFTEPSMSRFYSMGIEGYEDGDGENSLSDFCTADGVISVGAMNLRRSYTMLSGEVRNYDPGLFGPLDSISNYSSYSLRDALPLVVAPGTDVISAVTDNFTGRMVAEVTDAEGRRWLWGSNSGTSMATPLVAGVMALWLQACPDLTYNQVVEVIEHCSTPMEPYERSRYGYFSAYDGLKYVIENFTSSIGVVSPDRPTGLLVKRIGEEWEVTTPVGVEGGRLAVTATDGAVVFSRAFDGCSCRVSLPGSPGLYIITVTTDRGSFVQKVMR